MMSRSVRISALIFAVLAAHVSAQERQVVADPTPLPGLPFSPAIRTGNLIFVSGQIGNVPGTRTLVSGGVAAETRQAMENIRRVLEAAGSSMSRVVKCTVFLADIADYSAMNQVYATFFPIDPPARSTLSSPGLAMGARIEVECIAVSGGS